MTTPISSGTGRGGRAALMSVLALSAISWLTLPAYSQDEPVKPGDSAAIKAEDRLPNDEPKGSSATSTGTTSANSTNASSPSSAGQPSQADMMKMMMEMSKVTDNHKLLASFDGNWDYTVKMWMNGDPGSKPQESKGSATRKSIMGGRFVVMNVNGKMQMPGPDGKLHTMDFNGMGTEGYDNAKKKFVGSWIDNMGTAIMLSEGTYDPASKSFTYTGVYEYAPGVKQQIREVVSVPDKNHMKLEWYEDRGGQEAKTMQIDYTRRS